MEEGKRGPGGKAGRGPAVCEDSSIGAARRKRLEIRRFRMMMEQIELSGAAAAADDDNYMAPAMKKPRRGGGRAGSRGEGMPCSCTAGQEGEDLGEGVDEEGCRSEDNHDQCPMFGVVSVCGRRREMEDTVTAMPSFLELQVLRHRQHQSSISNNCSINAVIDNSNNPASAGDASAAADHASTASVCSSDQADTVARKGAKFHFFGVYDGHSGVQVAQFCKEHLHIVLARQMRKLATLSDADGDIEEEKIQWRTAFEASFRHLDDQLSGSCRREPSCPKELGKTTCCHEPLVSETVGSTAVVAVVGRCQIFVANCGDSRAVLSRAGQAIPLSSDHKPNRLDEVERIEAVGGHVIDWNGHRVLGVLAMSRAIGDRYLKPYLISEPEVTCTRRSQDDECLILASDGLWDVISNDMACSVARRCLASWHSKHGEVERSMKDESPAEAAAALLTKLAFAKNSKDNITVIVVDLKAHHSHPHSLSFA